MAYLLGPCHSRLGSGAVHPGRLPTLVLLLLVPSFAVGTLGDPYEPLVAAPQGVRTLEGTLYEPVVAFQRKQGTPQYARPALAPPTNFSAKRQSLGDPLPQVELKGPCFMQTDTTESAALTRVPCEAIVSTASTRVPYESSVELSVDSRAPEEASPAMVEPQEFLIRHSPGKFLRS